MPKKRSVLKKILCRKLYKKALNEKKMGKILS